MKKGLKIAVAGGAVGVISLAGAGLASAHGPGNSEARAEVTGRAAEILGVDAGALADAISHAREEMHDERLSERLERAVQDGVISAADADEIRAWLDARPGVLDGIRGVPHHRAGNSPALETRLAGLVEDGTITQADADAVLEWSASRPQALDELRPDHGGRRGVHHGPGRGFQMRIAPGADGEVGRFGGFIFRLPPEAGPPPADGTAPDDGGDEVPVL